MAAPSPTMLSFATAAVAAPGTSVAPSAGVPDNCHSILVTNPSTTETGLVGQGTPGAALVAGTNAQRVGPDRTLTLGVGTDRSRGRVDQAIQAGSGLIFDATAALTLEITYECLVGTSG